GVVASDILADRGVNGAPRMSRGSVFLGKMRVFPNFAVPWYAGFVSMPRIVAGSQRACPLGLGTPCSHSRSDTPARARPSTPTHVNIACTCWLSLDNTS